MNRQGLLEQLVSQLQQSGLWQSEPVPQSALESQVPFAIDSLSFEQWLQFIYLPRMQLMLDQDEPWPQASIAPMAEVAWPNHPHLTRLHELLLALDQA